MDASGLPGTSSNFFGRERDLLRIWGLVGECNNILLLAPRRVGKTSLMGAMREQARAKNYQAAFLDVGSVASEGEFVRKLLESIADPNVLQRIIKSPFFPSVKKLTVAGNSIEFGSFDDEDWRTIGERVAQMLAAGETPWLFLVDEFPIFVNQLRKLDPGRARGFLEWFRTLRHAAPKVRWLLSGSIGLDKVARDGRMSDTINDLLPVTDFGPYPLPIARAFIDQLGIHYGTMLEDEVREHLIQKVGWPIPFHLRQVFDRHRKYCADHDLPATVATLDAAYEKLINDRSPHLNWWDERLTELYGEHADRHARTILRTAARAGGEGATLQSLRRATWKGHAESAVEEEHDRLVNEVLDALVSDGYLRREAGPRSIRYLFLSSFLRDFWMRFKAR